MDLVQAAAWGIAGGISAGLISFSSSIVAAGHRWPWHDNGMGAFPYATVFAIGLIIGGVVAGAAHNQITGEWPALIMGASAPSVLRGVLTRIEVAERKPESTAHDQG